jgi:acetyl-CoA synthetase
VVEVAAIGVPDELKGMALVVFCVLKDVIRTADEMHQRREHVRNELKHRIIAAMGKSLAPKAIFFVSELPKTRNAKVMRRIIRSAYLGLEQGDISSLVNPQAVEEIKQAR